jgi:hypothetical protein
MADNLLCKCEALSSNPNPNKNKILRSEPLSICNQLTGALEKADLGFNPNFIYQLCELWQMT